MEEWRVAYHSDKYEVSSLGRVRRIGKIDCLKPSFSGKGGYGLVQLGAKNAKKVHPIVAFTFIGVRPHGLDINHIDGNKRNNYTNLEWVTNQENMIHVEVIGIGKRGKKHKHNTSGYVGVTCNKATGKYQAQISANGKKQYLGVFKTAEEAALKYNESSMLIYGDAPNEVICND